MRRIVALIVVPLIAGLALAGCGSSKPPPANSTVSAKGAFGAKPTVTIPKVTARPTPPLHVIINGKGGSHIMMLPPEAS